MQPHRSLRIILFVLMMGTTSFAAPTPTETKKAGVTWSALLASLDAKRPFDADGYNGARVLFNGALMGQPGGVSITHALSRGKERPIIIGVAIFRYDAAGRQSVDQKIVCRVILRENEIEKVAEYPGGSICVQVFGKITRIDAATKTIEIQSEGTSVTAAN